MEIKLKIITIILCTLFLTSCGNKKTIDNALNEVEKDKFQEKIGSILEVIENSDYDREAFNSNNRMYSLSNNLLFGYNYNSKTNSYDYNLNVRLDNFDDYNGIIMEDEQGFTYISIESSNYCAVKKISEVPLNIYDITEKEKCHITYTVGNFLQLNINSIDTKTNLDYISGTVSTNDVSLVTINNLLDSANCTYEWYRNGEKIDDAIYNNYLVSKDEEDAIYYAEMTTYEGKTVKSNAIHVKIKK